MLLLPLRRRALLLLSRSRLRPILIPVERWVHIVHVVVCLHRRGVSILRLWTLLLLIVVLVHAADGLVWPAALIFVPRLRLVAVPIYLVFRL